jgi:hypothetical protein
MLRVRRSVIREIRAMIRRLTSRGNPPRPGVTFKAGSEGLTITTHGTDVCVAYHQEGAFTDETFALSLEYLAELEAKDQLGVAGKDSVTARWTDSGIPRAKDLGTWRLEDLPVAPDPPTKFVVCDHSLVTALAEASRVSTPDTTRYALDKIQLRGTGDVAATNGKQLVVVSGFSFGWAEDQSVLIPSSTIYGCKELSGDLPVSLARTTKHVFLRIGPWTFTFTLDSKLKFPDFEPILPKATSDTSTLTVDPEDAAYLLKTLPKLPLNDEEAEPMTLDLNGKATIRARINGQKPPTEFVLSRSQTRGPAVRVNVVRHQFLQGLEFGLRELCVIDPEKPLLFRDEKRKYVFMPLSKNGIIAPASDAQVIASASPEASVNDTNGVNGTAATAAKPKRTVSPRPAAAPVPETAPAIPALPETNGNGAAHELQPPLINGTAANGTSNGVSHSLMEEAQALKAILHDALGRSTELIRAIQRQRKQTRLVQTTLANLRQLHRVEV